ncbi:hypothetical protein [Mycobacterium mantenii]|uniref:Uncharacterized protein n=1 Tax=Mycobacterium mantenii TaxID=560555 RepID=A0A1A2T9Q3_MYCNT|nr:hypothetical protein [Mycobacterium mantenii]OBH47306.1 hypothetical protein A5688_03110 [Mycobacterium mantenii]OBH73133.1 hypothetical protein A5683_25270 [Mycobacterium mantenii]
MHTQQTSNLAIVYGDADTVQNHADLVRELAHSVGLDIKAWHSDPHGTRQVDPLDSADGLVSALSDCARLHAALFVPYPVDMPGAQTPRLVANWLNRRGLRLQLGPAIYCWEHPVDEFDFAVRRTLDAAQALDAAVVGRRAVPTIEALLDQLTGGLAQPDDNGHAGVLDTEPRFRRLRIRRDRDLAAGLQVPPEPDLAAAWPERRLQTRAFARWLQSYASQSLIADVLNSRGVKPQRGHRWTQPMVSRLLRGERSPHARSDAA